MTVSVSLQLRTVKRIQKRKRPKLFCCCLHFFVSKLCDFVRRTVLRLTDYRRTIWCKRVTLGHFRSRLLLCWRGCCCRYYYYSNNFYCLNNNRYQRKRNLCFFVRSFSFLSYSISLLVLVMFKVGGSSPWPRSRAHHFSTLHSSAKRLGPRCFSLRIGINVSSRPRKSFSPR